MNDQAGNDAGRGSARIMRCAVCGHANSPRYRFCEECGAPLARRCGTCGSDASPAAKFCGGCGAPLVPDIPERGESRKVVTIVFADLVGSTGLHERLDAESARRVMERYYAALRTTVEAHGGTVVKLLGDGVMAAFGVPRVAEDDAVRAVRAAVAIVERVSGLGSRDADTPHPAPDTPLSVRVAVNTGEVVVSGGNDDIVGDPVNVAARLQQEAAAGEVLVGEATRRLVGDRVTLEAYGELALKGRTETVTAYRLVSLDRPSGAPALAFVGRDDELRRLTAGYQDAVAARAARLVVLLGSPGLGKSRLLAELARRLGERALVISGHCEAAGRSTFAPVADALRALLGFDDAAAGDVVRAAIERRMPAAAADRGRVASGVAALLAGTADSTEETFFVVRRFLSALAAEKPVVLAIDDLHWAEPLLLDLTEHLVQWATDVPLFVLVAARPELRDVRSSLASAGGLVAEVVALSGLDAGAAARLAANAIGADELPAAVAGRVLAISEGNPLFVGELVRMLVDEGTLKREGNRWTTTVELATLEMPPTIHALLAARIERLRPDDRAVLERAAIVGRHFSRAAVAHLLPPEIDDLDARLESLRRSELLETEAGWFLGEPALRFHHALIRDAAYRRLLKGTRAELHGRFADWAQSRIGHAVEHDEIIGWHLEQAHQLLSELGPIDAAGRAFGERAARCLAAAGRRALDRDDVALAANLLGRALDRLDPSDPARAELALDWCEALLTAGDVGPATTAVAELGRFAGSDRLRAWHTCFAAQLAVLTEPAKLRETAAAVAMAAATLESLADAAGEAKAHAIHAAALVRLGEIGACEAALDRALAAARRAGDRRRANAVLAGAPLAALWGPSPVTRASGRCLDVVRVLRITQGAPAVEAVALRCQAVLEALRGRSDAARRMIVSSRQMVEELGITQQLLETEMFAGLIDLLENDAVAAEHCLRKAYDGLRDRGLGIDAARAAALLARALLAQGRAADTEVLSRESEALAGDDLKAAIAWRGVRAEALAQRGEHEAAVALARAAVDIAAATDALLDHADARRALAAALRAARKDTEADAEEARAIELWEAKGAAVLADRTRRSAAAEPVSPIPGDRATTPASIERKVRPNTAIASLNRFRAAIEDRDLDALAAGLDEKPAAPPLAADRFANAATRAEDRMAVLLATGNVEAMAAGLAPGFRLIDRRKVVNLDLDREQHLAFMRIVVDMPRHRVTRTVLGTRGEWLSLSLTRFEGVSSLGGFADNEMLLVTELNSSGQHVAQVMFDCEDLDAAYVELDARYAAGNDQGERRAALTRAFCDAFAARNWEALAALLAPDLIVNDHRPLGWETLHGPAEYVHALESLVDLAPDVELRVDHLTMAGGCAIYFTTWRGTRDGGAFESPSVIVADLDEMGRIRRFDQFDLDQLAEARKLFDETGSTTGFPPYQGGDGPALSSAEGEGSKGQAERPPPGPLLGKEGGPLALVALAPQTPATIAADRVHAAFAARDWAAMRATCRPDAKFEDRRRHVLLSGDLDWWIADVRGIVETTPDVRYERQLTGTLGSFVALERIIWSAAPSGERVEVEYLRLTEVDDRGRIVGIIGFDADDRPAAAREMLERYARGEGAKSMPAAAFEVARALNDHDLRRFRAALADDFIMHDHRRTGIGRIDDVDYYVESLAALFEAAPDLTFETLYFIGAHQHASLAVARCFGKLAGGGEVESVFLRLIMHRDGCVARVEMFELDDFEVAKARFEELARIPAEGRTLASAAPPNAATRLRSRINDAFLAKDWDAMRALARDDLVFEDRRKFSLMNGGVDLWIKSAEAVQVASGVAFKDQLIGTLGDRIDLRHRVVTGIGPDGGAFESEFVLLTEIDADGRLMASINFDVDARAEALTEARDRLAASRIHARA
jgi:class 3 adenylate cyclase